MKKIVCMAAVLFAAFSMVSCSSSPEDKAKEFCERGFELGKKGDMEGISKLAEEEQEYINSLTPEEQKEYQKAVKKWTKDKIGNILD